MYKFLKRKSRALIDKIMNIRVYDQKKPQINTDERRWNDSCGKSIRAGSVLKILTVMINKSHAINLRLSAFIRCSIDLFHGRSNFKLYPKRKSRALIDKIMVILVSDQNKPQMNTDERRCAYQVSDLKLRLNFSMIELLIKKQAI